MKNGSSNASSAATRVPSRAATEAEPSAAFECVVSAEIIRRAMLVRSAEETRYYLTGVHVSPHPEGGAYVVGTDGSVLAIFHDEKAHVVGQAIISPDEHLQEALSSIRGDPRERLLVARADRLYVADCPRERAAALLGTPTNAVVAAQYRRATIDGKYPDWRRVFLPLDPTGVVPVLDAKLLSKLSKALCLSKRHVALKPTGPDHDTPAWAFGDFPRSAGVIMGVRKPSGFGDEIPGWVGEIVKPTAADPKAGTTDPQASPGRTPQ